MKRSVQGPTVAAAAALIGGVAIVIVPQHALTIVQLVVVTGAVAAGLHVVVSAFGSKAGDGSDTRQYDRWARLTSPFRRVRLPDEPRTEPPEIERTRNYLGGQRLDFGRDSGSRSYRAHSNLPPLPPEVVRRLARILRASLHHRGIDPTLADPQQPGLDSSLSSLSLAVLAADQEQQSREKQKPRERNFRPRYLSSDSAKVSQVVHAVLDDVDRLHHRSPARTVQPTPQLTSTRGPR